ncbi:hypothetical protein Y900_023965 [Mycolicibacterium aromaticivorans JS19b1 = JCM 16368]|uniref:Uncharacterized protein n=1 Tax=Mycolicibacterium aromaticivorans JS19b1 = JCM 16368 TaxID=1440774 RepID=A0A064CQG8_9MYCO|nr:DUF167 domain-containing protein [Mycolicibacterium aromaticivorans]KDF01902.1 hypothetical protein Y900_023965 [Mycolicibacterium aromaticivorans JS19b1 = JCM 16368]
MSRTVVVTVKPGSRKGPLVETADDGSLTIFVREPANEGKATEAAARLLAEHLGVARSAVTLTAGATSRVKRFRVD